MKPFIVLLVTFGITFFTTRLNNKEYDLAFAARIGMSSMLLFTAVGHFAFTKGMMLMIPEFIPYKKEAVFLTGIIEILAAIGLLIPSLRIITAWLLVLFFILVLPANIHAAIRRIDFQTASFEGTGVNYLWFRVPLQILFIFWTYFSSIKG